jgi:chromosome segregation ATPase
MAHDTSQSQEIDLDATDKLPILKDVYIDEDVQDDAVRLDYAAAAPAAPVVTSQAADFARPSALDLPSLAESVRSVEERIARQNADYEALNRLYEKARDAQLAAGTRADALASELTAAQSALAVEHHRLREMERVLAETNAAATSTRARVEEALRESERSQTEARTLRDSLVARDATIAQVLRSLGERDAQLTALQREHAKVVPDLEARSQAGAALEALLQETRTRGEALAQDLTVTRQSLAEAVTRVARGESALDTHRKDLGAAKLQAASYLEILSSREWRSGFNQNLFREWDAKIDAAQTGHGALQAECDRLKQTAVTMGARIAEQDEAIAKLQAAAAAETATATKRIQELQDGQRVRSDLQSRIDSLDADRKRLDAELATRGQELAEARVHGTAEALRVKESMAAGDAKLAELTAQITQLQSEAATHEEEMTVLMAHLNEARRPTHSIQADLKRLNDELALKALAIDQLNEDNRTLRATLERTRGALEERELLIRRLERSASNNANVLGRLQTSIERLGTSPASAPAPAAAEYVAELVRLDAADPTTHVLGRRTRIGRAPGCELQIESQSVSRNHAMILKGARELIIEDLNSTNGVSVNGRKISRHVLSDGDALTIGEIQFRCVLKSQTRPSDTAPDASHTGTHPAVSAPVAHATVADLRPAEPPKAADQGPAVPGRAGSGSPDAVRPEVGSPETVLPDGAA